MALAAVPGRLLDLRVNRGTTPRTLVESGEQGQLLVERGNPEARVGGRGESGWKDLAASLRITSFMYPQTANLVEREVEGIKTAVGTGPVGKDLGDVADGVEVDVVSHDRHVVLREHDIRLPGRGPVPWLRGCAPGGNHSLHGGR